MQFDTYVINGVDRVSLPRVSPALRGRMLDLYVPNKLHARLVWSLVKRLPVLGRLKPLAYRSTGPSPRIDGFDWSGWLAEICRALNQAELLPAFYFPPQPTRKKCGALLFDIQGHPVAFAKLAWGAAELEELLRERSGLEFVAQRRFEAFDTPSLLHSATFDARAYTLFSVIPLEAGRAGSSWNAMHQCYWQAVQDATGKEQPLADIGWWPEVRRLGGAWQDIADLLEQHAAATGFEFCAAHGDFAPWNMRVRGDRLYLFDWENFEPAAPSLLDPYYFLLTQSVLLKNLHLPAAIVADIDRGLAATPLRPTKLDIALAQAYLRTHATDQSMLHILDALIALSAGRS